MNNIQWVAEYNDGSHMNQYNGDGSENKYIDIDRDKLSKFIILKNNNPFLILNLTPNKKLIYRKRVAQSLLTNSKQEVHLVGWQETINGKNIQNISFLFDDGHIEVLDRFYNNHKWFYPIKFLSEEL